MSLGRRLAELRQEKGLTLVEAAEVFHSCRSSISAYENDTRRPSLKLLIDFADYYGVTVDYLLGKSDDRNIYVSLEHIPDELRRIGVDYMVLAKEMEDKRIPADDIKKLLNIIENLKQ